MLWSPMLLLLLLQSLLVLRVSPSASSLFDDLKRYPPYHQNTLKDGPTFRCGNPRSWSTSPRVMKEL